MSGETFDCIVCGATVATHSGRYFNRPDHVAPLCGACERVKGYAWNGSRMYRSTPMAGAYMDRRKATQILALADAIDHEARLQQWSANHAA